MQYIHSSPEREPTARTPHWVKVFGTIAVIVVVLFVVLLVVRGGQHGPRRHIPSGSGDRTVPSQQP